MHRETCPDGQFWLTLTGHWKVRVGKEVEVLGPTDVQFYQPVQSAKRMALEDSIGFGVQVRPGKFEKSLVGWVNEAPRAMPLLRVLFKQFMVGGVSALVAEELVATLLAEDELAPVGKSKMNRVVGEATDLLVNQYTTEIGMTDIAAAVGVSPSYLSSAFRSVHGVTMTDFRRQRRLSSVLSAVTSQSEPVGQACISAGFYDTSHFFRAFRQTYGFSPAKLNDLFLSES